MRKALIQISRFQQDIALQDEIRDELIIELNNNLTDENAKSRIEKKIINVDEKVQALGMYLTFTKK